MSPSCHLPAELLIEYAAGALDPALAVLVDGHLALCPQCQSALAAGFAIGGALLEAIEPEPVADDAFDRLMARIDDGAAPEARPALPEPAAAVDDPLIRALPDVLRPLGRRSLAKRRWRTLVPGVRVLDLDVPLGAGASAQIIKVGAGKGVPRHIHRGREYTLVLSGAFNDGNGRFARGDVQISDGDASHKPVAEPGEVCMVLAVTDAPLRLTGALGLIQRSLGY